MQVTVRVFFPVDHTAVAAQPDMQLLHPQCVLLMLRLHSTANSNNHDAVPATMHAVHVCNNPHTVQCIPVASKQTTNARLAADSVLMWYAHIYAAPIGRIAILRKGTDKQQVHFRANVAAARTAAKRSQHTAQSVHNERKPMRVCTMRMFDAANSQMQLLEDTAAAAACPACHHARQAERTAQRTAASTNAATKTKSRALGTFT
jgi:hypothetical protein